MKKIHNISVITNQSFDEYQGNNEVYMPRTLSVGNENNAHEEELYIPKTLSDLIQQKANQEDESRTNPRPMQSGEQPYEQPRLEDALKGGRG